MVKLTPTGVKINTKTSHNTGGVEFNTGGFCSVRVLKAPTLLLNYQLRRLKNSRHPCRSPKSEIKMHYGICANSPLGIITLTLSSKAA